MPMVLVGNKIDLEEQRQVSTREGVELARSFACPFFETSAKSRINVEEAFYECVREICYHSGGNAGGIEYKVERSILILRSCWCTEVGLTL